MIDDLGLRLQDLIAEHRVPGAAVGVLHDGELIEAAAGVVNLDTGVAATTDTVFQIGSVSKVWTVTVIMQLVEEGTLDLDAPVCTYLPDFSVADEEVSATVTLRHLLSHTSGIDGDHFDDHGRGDDCLERYVASCNTLRQTHALGETMSYCNTGYAIAGRVIEVVTGRLWDDVMRERLFGPLGLKHTSTLPEEALLHRAAAGHVSPEPGQDPQLAPRWMLPRVCGPMGLINATVRDVLTFARMHMDAGLAPDGTRLLSEDGVTAMQEPQVEIPDPHTLGSHWGVGWILFEWGPGGSTPGLRRADPWSGKRSKSRDETHHHRLYGHDGNTIGQSASLRVAPDANLAVCVLANGGETGTFIRALLTELFAELAGIEVPQLPVLPDAPLELDLTPYAGTYERLSVRLDLAVEDGRLAGTTTLSGPMANVLPNPVQQVWMQPVDTSTFLVYHEGDRDPTPAVFYDFQDDEPRYVHLGARTHPKKRR